MNRASSCAQVYPKSVQNSYSTEYDDRMISFCQVGKVDVRSYGLQNDVANACLQFFFSLHNLYGYTSRNGRNGPLFDRIFFLGLCTQKSRSYCYDGLKELEDKGLIRRPRKKLPGNRGGTIEFRVLPSMKTLAPSAEGNKVLFFPLSNGAPPIAGKLDKNENESKKIQTTSTDRCTPVRDTDSPLTPGKTEETTLCNSQITVLNPQNARQSDFRAKGVETTKKEVPEVKFTKILTKGTSKRQKNRVLNWLLTDLYRIAFRELGGYDSRWLLGRAVVEIGCPENAFHSGVDWEQLARHYSEMTKGERGALITSTILPLLTRKPDRKSVATAVEISKAHQVDRKQDMRTAAKNIRAMVERGELSDSEALEMLRAQEHLLNWRDWTEEAAKK